jgi:hypothetical protein
MPDPNHVQVGVDASEGVEGRGQCGAKGGIDGAAHGDHRNVDLVGEAQLATRIKLHGVGCEEAGVGEDFVRLGDDVPDQHRQLVERQADGVGPWTAEHLDDVADQLHHRVDRFDHRFEQGNDRFADVERRVEGIDPAQIGGLEQIFDIRSRRKDNEVRLPRFLQFPVAVVEYPEKGIKYFIDRQLLCGLRDLSGRIPDRSVLRSHFIVTA